MMFDTPPRLHPGTARLPAVRQAVRLVACAGGLMLCAGLAQAAAASDPAAAASGASRGDAQARYERERARCLAGKSQEATDTCLKEAGAALQAARQHDLSDPGAQQLQANALRRCDAFKSDADRRDCIARVTQGSADGSVGGGGVLREYHEMVPGTPVPTPATAASAGS